MRTYSSTTSGPRSPSPVDQAISDSILNVLSDHAVGCTIHDVDRGIERWSADLPDLAEFFRGSLTRSEIKTGLNLLVEGGHVELLPSDCGLLVMLSAERGSEA